MATYVSNPYWSKEPPCFARRVDYEFKEFVVHWKGNWRRSPDLADLSILENDDVSHHSPELAQAWKKSRPLAYGAYAQIRISLHTDDAFPIFKIAHSYSRNSDSIEKEFPLLKELRAKGMPVIEPDSSPLEDANGVFGFMMKRLETLTTQGDLAGFASTVREFLRPLWDEGFVHGDGSPSNIMKDEEGKLVLIDFGEAGRIGKELPRYSIWRKNDGYTRFSIDMDEERLNSLFTGFGMTG